MASSSSSTCIFLLSALKVIHHFSLNRVWAFHPKNLRQKMVWGGIGDFQLRLFTEAEAAGRSLWRRIRNSNENFAIIYLSHPSAVLANDKNLGQKGRCEVQILRSRAAPQPNLQLVLVAGRQPSPIISLQVVTVIHFGSYSK